ncbi:3512_t:CDS:2, partial [Funneliformis geosporum]
GIHFDIEELLTSNVNRYYKSKYHQKIKIEANTSTDGSNTFSQLDGFEKQLEEREALLRQKENNIKKTIEAQVDKERKCLKDEYNALMARKEKRQYKSRISTLEKSIAVKDKEIGKLSATISQLKNDKKDIKKLAEYKYKDLENVIFTKDLKIIALNDKIISYTPHTERDATIEPSSYFSYHNTKLWTGKWKDAKNDLNIRKKYTFRMQLLVKLLELLELLEFLAEKIHGVLLAKCCSSLD